MEPLPPDPYKALGVPRDADIALIKKTFRKLALSCHPDKVADESLKQQKQEEFHKINQAYELIGDETSRQRYDDEFKLEQLRSEKLARGGAKVSEPTATRYGVRTQAPSKESFTADSYRRYEERKPSSRSYDDRSYDDRSRKYSSHYDSYSKPASGSRSSREKESTIKITRIPADRTRSDHKKSRDKEERRARESRFNASVESDSEEDRKARYEAEYRRRSEEARMRDDEEAIRRAAAEARRKAEERRSYDDKFDRQRKMSEMENDAVRYMYRSRTEADRPSPVRTSSSRDVRPEYYDSRSRRDRDRPDVIRRSSARPKDASSSSGRERDRKGIEIVDWDGDDKRPSFKHSSSSPSDIHVPPRASPQRSYTESSRDHRRADTSPIPKFRRSETMPTRPSGLRESVTPRESGERSPDGYPTVPPPSSTTKYYYPTPNGGVRLSPEDVGVANGHRTVTRSPDHHRARSPSPLTRPPMGVNRPIDPSTNYPTAVPKVSIPPPPLGRSATMDSTRASEDRGRPLYGEIPTGKTRREARVRQTSFAPEQVSYAPKIGPEDISWSARRRETERDRDREFRTPPMNRHQTSVY